MPHVRLGRPGLLGTVPRTAVVAGTASLSGLVMRRGARQQSPGGYRLIDQLSQLAELHDRGVLSDEEFDTAKARLLSS